MQPIKIRVNATRAVCSERPDPITTGMVGLRAEFIFSEDWAGLQKTAVCAGSGVAKDILVIQDAITVPPECLTDPASDLKIGIYGTNSTGNIVIPTVYAYCGRLFRGADPSGDTSTDYTLPIWAQLQAMIGDLSNLTTTARDNLVAAINEAAKSGGGGGGSTVELDTTLSQSGKAADAKAVGDALATLENKIPTASGGMSVTAADLLVTILRNAEYSTDQSDKITALATALNATPEPDIPDVPEGPDEPIVVRYAITNNLTECVNSNAATSLTEGASYTATLTASDGFVLDAVTVTMGGVDVTASVYADGVITIPSVTGDVVITASAVVVKTEELPFVSGQTYTVNDVEVTEGHIFSANGTITENNSFSYAVFPCRGANRVMFNSSIYSNYGVLMLDANKTYLRTVGTTQTSGLFTSDGLTTCEVSRDAEYIMFQCRATNMPNITVTLYQDPEYNGAYELNTWYRIPWRDGYSVNSNTGVIAENANAMCSDYMSIYGATTLKITNGLRHFHVFYDADKNYLSAVTVQSTAPVSYNIPNGATYLVIAPPGGAQHHNCSIRINE